jgi:hypothetical protein
MSTIAMPSLRCVMREIRQRLLMVGIDFHQNHVFGIVLGDDEPPHELPVGIVVVTAEINPKLRRQAIRLDILVRGGSLISVEGREGLQLDQLRLKLAIGVAHQPKIHLHEHRQRSSLGTLYSGGMLTSEARRYSGLFTSCATQFTAIFRHAIEQLAGDETRRLRDAKVDVRAGSSSSF